METFHCVCILLVGLMTQVKGDSKPTFHEDTLHGRMYEDITVDLDDPKLNIVDLRSDCATKVSKEMKDVMIAARTGDDESHEDKATIELETFAAKMLGKDAALFVPTVTMGNLIAALVHCTDRSSEIIVGDKSHTVRLEQASAAKFGGINYNTVPTNPEDGTFTMEDLRDHIREVSDHEPRTCMIAIENTHNFHGGLVLPLPWLDELGKFAGDYKIPVHMDGARLFQSVIASGVKADRITRGSTSVTIALSKIGAPIGAILAGSKSFIKEARRTRKGLGGQMTQIGFMSAAALYSLKNHVDIIKGHQDIARQVANGINALESKVMRVNVSAIQTNIFVVKMHKKVGATTLSNRLMQVTDAERRELKDSIVVLSWPRDKNSIRIVISSDVTPEKAQAAIRKFAYVVKELSSIFGRSHPMPVKAQLLSEVDIMSMF